MLSKVAGKVRDGMMVQAQGGVANVWGVAAGAAAASPTAAAITIGIRKYKLDTCSCH